MTTALATGHYVLVAQRCTVRLTARGFGLLVRGAFTVRAGEVHVDDTGSTVTTVLDAASFHTGNPRRDRDVVSDRFLAVNRFPDIAVTGRWDGSAAPMRAEVTVRDVTAPVEVEIVEVDRTPGGAVARARARLDRRAFPVGSRWGPVGRRVDVELTITLLGS